MKSSIKYLVAATAALLSFTGLHAQLLTGGIEGEFTTSSVKISDINKPLINAINGNGIMGYEIGPFLKLAMGPFYIKPKFLLSYQSGTGQAVYLDQQSEDVSFSVTKLDIPVLAGLKIIGPLSIEAGPVYDRIISATKDFNGTSIDLRPGGLGYRIGANVQLGMAGFNISYEGIQNNSSATFASFETPNELIFGASLSFGK